MRTTVSLSFLCLGLLSCGGSSGKGEAPPPAGKFLEFDAARLQNSVTCPTEAPQDQQDGGDAYSFSETLIQEKLSQDGLRGFVHGVVPGNKQFVMTYRSEDTDDPMAFFKAQEFSLVSRDPSLTRKLESLNRHDEIIVKGQLLSAPRPMRHILLDSFELVQAYPEAHEISYEVDETSFAGLDRVTVLAKVHAVMGDGLGLVLEYKDMILPVFVLNPYQKLAAQIYRNDKILITLTIKRDPGRPLHFYTDTGTDATFQIVDAIKNCHQQSTTLEGTLVLFKKSPQINRDVYAVKVVDSNGIQRNFTFFPNIDFSQEGANEAFSQLFESISRKSVEAWNQVDIPPLKDRNHLHQPAVTVRVTGILNIVSKTQANPQVYINDIQDLKFFH